MTQPTTCFTLIHQGSDESAFIVRLSHAHYDGACYGPLFKQVGAIYADPEAAPHAGSDFPGYRRACARLGTPQAFEHWKDILADSEVTRLPRLSAGEDAEVIYSGVCAPAAPPAGITMATAIKAAWAYVLARETGKTDILFGQVTNCRGILPDGGEGMVGMCLNTTPVRVEIKPTTRVRDVLAMVQQQHIKSVEYETNDWFDIVARSTSWSADTDLDSGVLHENFPTLHEMTLGNATGQMIEPIFKDTKWTRHLLITFPGPQGLVTFFVTRKGALDNTMAEGLVPTFNDTLVRFLASPDDVIGPVS